MKFTTWEPDPELATFMGTQQGLKVCMEKITRRGRIRGRVCSNFAK